MPDFDKQKVSDRPTHPRPSGLPSTSSSASAHRRGLGPLNLFRCHVVHGYVDDLEIGEHHGETCEEYATEKEFNETHSAF